MRRPLVSAALLLVAVVALVALWPSWNERAPGPARARTRVDPPARAGLREEAASAETARRERDGDAPPTRVHGLVTGAMGGLWGARVVAYRAGSEDVLAEAHTNPEGLYSLALEPDVAFDLAVEPSDLTGLLPERRERLVLSAGEERQEDVALAEGAVLRGRVVDEDGRGRNRIEISAVPEDPLGTPVRARSTDDGVFRLRGLVPGRYSLEVTDMAWLLAERVSIHTGGPDVVLVIVPALTVNVSVKDVETAEPVPAFTVRVRDGDRVLLDAAGRDGRLFTRMRWPGAPPRSDTQMVMPRYAQVEVAAPGFVPTEPIATWGEGAAVWLVPDRDPNTTVRVSFEDRSPYLGDLIVRFTAKSGRGAAGAVRFGRVRAGVYRGALPSGRWDISVWVVSLLSDEPIPAEANVVAGWETELAFVLPAGGTLRLLPPAGAERAVVSIRSADDAARGRLARQFLVPREGAHVQGIPPGVYQVGYERVTEFEPGRFLCDMVWFRDVTVVMGGSEEIRLPSR